jgi:hypothetical protein
MAEIVPGKVSEIPEFAIAHSITSESPGIAISGTVEQVETEGEATGGVN